MINSTIDDSQPAGLAPVHGSALARDHATIMAYDAFRLCMGQEPKNHTLLDVVRWMGLVWKVDIREQMNRDAAASDASPLSPHEYKAHKKYPWFCGECGYPPHDEVKHIQNPEFTPAVFLNTCGCEPMTEETAEALGEMVKCAIEEMKRGDFQKPNAPAMPTASDRRPQT